MSEAVHDENRVPSLIGVSKTVPTTTAKAAVNPNTGALLVEPTETIPTDPSKLNPTTTLFFNAAGQMIYIDTIVGSDTYRETCSGTGAKLITDYVVSYTQTFGSSVKQ